MQVPSITVTDVRATDAAIRARSAHNRDSHSVLSGGNCAEQRGRHYIGSQGSAAFEFEGDLTTIQPDQLFAEFHPLVRRLIRQYGANADLRNDLEGEIYYRFCVVLKAFDPRRGVPLRPYIVRQLSASVYSYARNHWRRERREVSLELFAFEREPTQSMNPTADWDDALDTERFKQNLPGAIAKLTDRQRNVVIWRYYEQRTFEEIATRLDIQTSTARSLLRHALTHLRKYMAPSHIRS